MNRCPNCGGLLAGPGLPYCYACTRKKIERILEEMRRDMEREMEQNLAAIAKAREQTRREQEQEPAIAPRYVPDLMEPIKAWRYWPVKIQVDDKGGRQPLLYSGARDHDWTPYEALEGRHVTAVGGCGCPTCANARERARLCPGTPCDGHVPHEDPKCGIYGFKTAEALRADLAGTDPHSFAIGAVWLWGRMVEHEHGYRAQFAYPAHFEFVHGADGAALARAYGVEWKGDRAWKSVIRSDASSQSPWSPRFPARPIFPSLSASQLLPRVYLKPWNPPILLSSPLSSPSGRSGKAISLIVSGGSGYVVPPPLAFAEEKAVEIFYKPAVRLGATVRIRQPKGEIEQASFNARKPLRWYYDKARKIWLRLWDDQPNPWRWFSWGTCSWCGLPRRKCREIRQQVMPETMLRI